MKQSVSFSNAFRGAAAAFVVAALPPSARALPGPASASYAWGAQLQVSGYDASKETLADFPVLVRVSPTTVNGFQYSQMTDSATGSDLCFIGMDGAGLPFEIDTWDPDGTSLVWVALPAMTNGAQFVMCWGSATSGKTVCADNPFAGYKGVWHMNATSPADASGSGNDGTASGNVALVAGPVGSGLSYPTTSDYVTCGQNLPNSELVGGFTIEGWASMTDYSGTHALFGKNLFMSVRAEGTSVKITTPGLKDHDTFSPGFPAANTWFHWAMSFVPGNGGLNFYVNGANVRSAWASGFNNKTDATEMWLARNQWESGQGFKGLIDEYRLSATVRSADWIAATYATQSDPSFLTAGMAMLYDATSEPIVSLSAPSSALGYTNATLAVAVGSLGMDAGKTTDADWVDLLLVVSANADLSDPVFSVPLSRVSSIPASLSAPLAPLALTTTYYAQVFATNSFGVAGESTVVSFATPVPGPVFTPSVNTEHIAPDISLAFTSAGLGGAVTRIVVDVSTSDDFSDPAVTKTYTVNLDAMPTNIADIALTGLPASSPLYYRFTAVNAANYSRTVEVEAANTLGSGDNVWSGLSEDIDDPSAYVFAGGLPASDKTLYFTRPAGLSPVIDRDVTMPSLRFTNGGSETVDTSYLGGYHSCGYDLSGTGVLTFNAERPILSATKGTNIVRNPILFNRNNNQTVYVSSNVGRLDLTGELMLPAGVTNTTMRANDPVWNGYGEVHFGGPSPDFMGLFYVELCSTICLDHPGAMTNVNRVYFGDGWGSFTRLRNNTGAPMTFPRCTLVDNKTDWSNTRACYEGAPFLFPVATVRHYDRGGDGTKVADVFAKNLVVLNSGTWFNKYGTGTFAVSGETTWESADVKHGIVLRNGCFWPQTAAGLPPSGEFFAPEGANNNMATLGLSGDYAPMLDGSSTPRVFQESTRTRWGFTAFGGDRTVCWNADSTLNLTNTTSDNVSIKLSAAATATNSVNKAYGDYYAYPSRFMFGNRSEFADGTILFRNPIRYELGQNWDTSTYFESTNHVVAARMRGSLKLGNRDKTWNFSGRNFGGYLALEADNSDFTGKVNVYEKGNLLVNSNLVARSVTVQTGSGLGGTASLSTEDGTTVKSGGALFGGEWDKGGTLAIGGKVVLESGSALRAEVGASNDRIGMVKLAAGSSLKLTAPVYVDIDTDPRVSPYRGATVKILDWSETTFDAGAAPTKADFVARPESNSDIETVFVFTRDDGLYVNYITVRYPKPTVLILR